MTPEADLDPHSKLFTRLVSLQPTPSPWPTIGRLALELVALVVAGGAFLAWIAVTHS